MEQNQEILGKIRKLLALAQSPNEAEAAAAALKAQELLQKYNLSTASVENAQSGIDCVDIESGTRQARWRMILLSGVAPAYFSQLLIVSSYGKYTYQLVGKPHNVEIARSMFDYLEFAINRISRESENKKRIIRSAEAFRLGMAHSIVSRLDVKRKGTPLRSLFSKSLVQNLYASERALVDSYIKNLGNVKFRSTTLNITSRGDFNSGLAAGKKVSLNGQINREGGGVKRIAHEEG